MGETSICEDPSLDLFEHFIYLIICKVNQEHMGTMRTSLIKGSLGVHRRCNHEEMQKWVAQSDSDKVNMAWLQTSPSGTLFDPWGNLCQVSS